MNYGPRMVMVGNFSKPSSANSSPEPSGALPQKGAEISLGMNSSMFTNCSVFCDVRHVQSSVLGQNVMFRSVQSSVLLLCDQTSLGTYSLMFANCSGFGDVRHV